MTLRVWEAHERKTKVLGYMSVILFCIVEGSGACAQVQREFADAELVDEPDQEAVQKGGGGLDLYPGVIPKTVFVTDGAGL